jgi:uncharacterized protein YjbJ (UPF0337 family)
MGIGDELVGKAKEVTGKVTDNDSLRKEGAAQQEKADAEYKAEQAKQEAETKEREAARAAAEEQRHK